MSTDFFARPILNSPYEEPVLHHDLDERGRPTGNDPIPSRRKAAYYTPVPSSTRGKASGPKTIDMLEEGTQRYDPMPIINQVRQEVAAWRAIPDRERWGVTPVTARLLEHWRKHDFSGVRPFFCQREAVETIIWLSEVAWSDKRYRWLREHVENANEDANPGLLRLAMKMATGAGKTTVMAMLIAWQTANAVAKPSSKRFAKGFLLVAPGITIRDRLRVLDPSDPESYYEDRELVPADLVGSVRQAKVVIQNYHAFQRRERMTVSKGTRGVLEGRRGERISTRETEGQMLQRACGDLLGVKGVVVINDEAHHCYRERAGTADEAVLKGEAKTEAKENNEAARLWISGIEALARHGDARAVYDLSATPFFLRGSGYDEGTLFPWTISDFSLMDAIECGIVKLPRVPILDNMPMTEDGKPIFRNLWDHIGKKLPKKGRGKAASGTAADLSQVTILISALRSLYEHYEQTHAAWKKAGHEVPPVFIVVCNNTSTSRLVHDWIAGHEVPETDDEGGRFVSGHLPLFSNYDEHGQRLPVPNTLLIDSAQLESGDGLDKAFRDAMDTEIAQFRRDKREREGADGGDVSDEDILREVMNTVGEKGKLGESIRCVVSVSMLTEGWDTNTVTHILGVRAFGTQLLCEQVVGRGLRRKSYDLNADGLFDVEYADIMGIPFDFVAKPTTAPPAAPKPVTRVRALREREALAISFPNVVGYRTIMPGERLVARFDADSAFRITPEVVGPTQTKMSGVVGAQETMAPKGLDAEARPSTITYQLARHLVESRFPAEDGTLDPGRFMQLKRIVSRWLDEGYLTVAGEGTFPAMVTWPGVIERAAERIFNACKAESREGDPIVSVVLDPFNRAGSTRGVAFNTTKPCFETSAERCHVSHVVEDSTWEAELARVVEAHPRVISYVKNQGVRFEVPWQDGPNRRLYSPDFIVRIDDGRGTNDPLNLVVEVKGLRGDDAAQKAATMRSLWVPGVNALGEHGRWAFEEFEDVFEMETDFGARVGKAFDRMVDGVVNSDNVEKDAA